MADNVYARAFRLATAPARFALRQTRTNLQLMRDLRNDFESYQPLLQRATEETLANVLAVLAAAEQSLPPDIEALTPGEREQAIAQSLNRGEQHLLAAVGELYRSYRLITTQLPPVIDNPPQESFGPADS